MSLIVNIVGTGVFVLIVLLLLSRLYLTMRKMKGKSPIIDELCVKLWGKNLGGLDNGIPKTNSTENQDKGRVGERVAGDKDKDNRGNTSTTSSSSTTNSTGTGRGNSNNIQSRIDSSSTIQSSSGEQRNLEPVRKYKSIFEKSD